MAEYTRAIQDTQAEGEEYKTRALESAHENIVRLAAKDETIATQQVRLVAVPAGLEKCTRAVLTAPRWTCGPGGGVHSCKS